MYVCCKQTHIHQHHGIDESDHRSINVSNLQFKPTKCANIFNPIPPVNGCSFCQTFLGKRKGIDWDVEGICKSIGPEYAALTDYEYHDMTVKKFLDINCQTMAGGRKTLIFFSTYFHETYYMGQQVKLGPMTASRYPFASASKILVCYSLFVFVCIYYKILH